jgi:hypothetical protein
MKPQPSDTTKTVNSLLTLERNSDGLITRHTEEVRVNPPFKLMLIQSELTSSLLLPRLVPLRSGDTNERPTTPTDCSAS